MVFSSRQDHFPFLQLFDGFFKLGPLPFRCGILARHFLQLFGTHGRHESRREESKRRVWTHDQQVVGHLHSYAVHKALACKLVIGSKDVMNFQHYMVNVAEGMVLSDFIQAHHCPMRAVRD